MMSSREMSSNQTRNLTIVTFKKEVLTEAKLNHVKALLSTDSPIQNLYDIGRLKKDPELSVMLDLELHLHVLNRQRAST
jgi:hypothetical protein